MVSLIVPVYNVSKYLKQCLDSIIHQSYSDIEILLIDDGSTDESGEICETYAEKDDRIKVIHKENGGLMSAWMCGIEHSSCDEIVFVDSDDWLPLCHIEKLVAMWEKYQADIIVGNFKLANLDNETRKPFIIPSGYYDENAIQTEIYPRLLNAGGFQERGLPICRWGKLIRKKLIIDNLQYCDTRVSYAEDLNIMLPVFLDCKSIVVYDNEEVDYYYRQNPNSILHKYNPKMYMQIRIVYDKLFPCIIEKRTEFIKNQMYADYLSMIVQCYKNELNNPEGLKKARDNISKLAEDDIFHKAVEMVDWNGYIKRYRLMIKCMMHWGTVYSNIVTVVMYQINKRRIK